MELIEANFDPLGVASVRPPYYIRKIPRRSHWYGPDDLSAEERNGVICADVFPCGDDGCVSIYRIESANDLHRVAVGLNANRGGGIQQDLFFICFTADELSTAGLQVVETPGVLSCDHANGMHCDIIHQHDGLLNLVSALKTASRRHVKFNKNRMKVAEGAAVTIGCRAATSNEFGCQCHIQFDDQGRPYVTD